MATTHRDIRDVVPPVAEIDPRDGAPSDPRDGAPSPAAILRAQAATWTERTNGEIVAEVEPAQVSSDKFVYWFSFVVPALDDYRYRLFRVEHGLELYPLRIAAGRTPESAIADVDDEDALYNALGRIFAAPETLNVVRQLRSMIAEQRVGGSTGRG